MAQFKESEHPRDNDGKFIDKEKSSSNGRKQKFSKALNTYANKRKSPTVTNQEWALWYKAIGDIERGERYEPTNDGKTYIPIDNKVFVTSGTYVKPNLETVIEFDSIDEMDDFISDMAGNDIW